MQTTVLAALNTYVEGTTNESPRFDFRIDFLCNNSNVFSGLILGDGNHELLEATNRESIDLFMTLFGAISDRLKSSSVAPVIKTYTMFCNL